MRRIAITLFLLLLFTPVAMGAQAYRFPAIGDIGDKGASGHRVRAYGAADDGSTDAEPEIATAITAAAGGIVIFDQAATSYRISSNVTIPAGTTAVFQEGGLLFIDGGVTFTVNGTLIAGNYQIFSGAGSVTLAAGSCDYAVPQWWGAVGDDSTDCFAAFTSAIAILDGGPGTMYIPSGTYRVSATLDNFPVDTIASSKDGIIIAGAGSGQTILVYKGTSGYLFSLENDEANSSQSPTQCVIRDLHIQAPDLTATGGGIEFSHSSFNQVEGVVFTQMAATYGIAINMRNQTKTVSESGFTNDTNRDFTTTGAGATEKYAIKFSNSSNVAALIKSITVRLGKTGAPAGTINAWIYSDSAGSPDAALSTASASVTNTDLSADADGDDVTFEWANYADRASLGTGVDGWVVLITTGYTYTDTTTEVRLRVDAGDGDVNEFGTYDTGGGGWGTTDDGSNNTIILRTAYSSMGAVFDNIHVYGSPLTPVGINLEDVAQLKIINSNIYADVPLQANFGGLAYSIATQYSGDTYAVDITGGKSFFLSGYMEGGPVNLDGGIHNFSQVQIADYVDSTDPTIVSIDGSPFSYYRGDNVGVKNDFWGNRIYPITSDSPLARQTEMTLAGDGDALTGEAGETTTYTKGFNMWWISGARAMLPRGTYLVTIWAKTDATVNNMYIASVQRGSGGSNTTLTAKNYALTTSYQPYRILHIVAAGDSTTYGTRLQVYKNSNNGNKMSISHITVQLLGEDELFSGNPVLYSPDNTDGDGARESELLFIGRQSGLEQTALASIKASHDGAADDEKGKLEIGVNDGDDGWIPTTLLTLDGDDATVTVNGELKAASIDVPAIITSEPRYMSFNLADPNGLQSADDEWSILVSVPAALTITNIKITLDAAGNELTGDLVYCDAFIGQASPVVINICDTTNGVLDDSAMGTAAVPAGKCIMWDFDGDAPNAAITQASFLITYDYD